MKRRMRRATRHRLTTLAAIVGLAGSVAVTAAIAAPDKATPPPVVAEAPAQPETPAPAEGEQPAPEPVPAEPVDPRANLGLDPDKFELVDDHYIQRLEDGRVVHLTLEPRLQKDIRKMIKARKPPNAGLAAIEPKTGRVLSMVSWSRANPKIENYALRAEAPSASVFKLVTAAALLELGNVDPNKPICYNGGSQHLDEEQVRGNPVTDHECADLGAAVGHSLNAIIARLAFYNLARADLEEMAMRFGFNREIPFELAVDVSEATFPEDDIERARTAAGFWNVNLSSLHGALISAAIANDGVMMRPTLVDRIEDANGKLLYTATPEPWLTVMSAKKAQTLQELAEETTTIGTAAKAFRKHKKWPKDLRVSGKTGTLSNKRPFVLYTWFVGNAPLENPNIAVGSVVANPRKWWIKGMDTSAKAIKTYQEIKAARARAAADE